MKYKSYGFTIVELLIVIVIIGILATIVIVSYNGVVDKAHNTTLQVDVDNASMLLETYKARNHKYPTSPTLANDGKDLPATSGNTISYNVSNDGKNYCVAATRDGVSYRKSSMTDKVEEGDCSDVSLVVYAKDGDKIQTITSDNCPSTGKIRAVDARDNHTYWVQKLADGKCWMLTNIAYAGGGTNTYGDVKSVISNGSGGGNGTWTYIEPRYYIPTGSSPTSSPSNPSTSTTGVGQYGYLYNWCAAMGSQVGTSACSSEYEDDWSHNVSICPFGWRLPIGSGSTYELSNLNLWVNAGRIDGSDADVGLLSNWLAQYGGQWYGGFYYQGSVGYYWSSGRDSSNSSKVMVVSDSHVNVGVDHALDKDFGGSVRCLADS